MPEQSTPGGGAPPDAPEVLHVTEAFGAGVATAMGQYARSFPASRHRALVSVRPESVAPDTTSGFAELDALPSFRVLAREYSRRAGRPDVVHGHSSKAGALVRLAARPGSARIVYSPHALAHSDRRWHEPRYWGRFVESALTSRADAYGAVSAHEADQLHRLGIPRHRIFEVPHFVPVPAIHRPAEPDAIVAIGRVCPQKDPAFFAATAAGLRSDLTLSDRRLEFYWIGAGDPGLTRLLQDAGVQVTGWMDRSKVLRFLEERAALVVHGARYEGLPIALAEAMSVGVPVVGRRIPSLAKLNSVLFVDSAAEAVDTSRTLLRTGLLAELSLAVRDEVRRKFSRDNQREALNRLYGVTS
jgi:glycosyltransferase involved in cell wall biosynthesis